jgi:ABC-2 type transport system permease protein
MLRFYAEVARTAFRRQLIYRWANIAGLLANVFFGCIFSYVTIALFRVRPVVAGYDVAATLRYVWLAQAMIMVVLSFGWYELMQTIRSGEVVTDLSKPCDFYWYWFSREWGKAGYFLLFRGLPTYLAGMVLFHIGLPGPWQAWLPFAVALALGAAVGIAYRFLYNVIAFWLLEARMLAILATVVALFFAGSYIPIPFMPGWLRAITNWLPFTGLLNLPAQVALGKVTGMSLILALTRQAAWLVVLTVGARHITARAFRRVVIQGG